MIERGSNGLTVHDEQRKRFRTMHERGCFVMPNAWDAGSARLLQNLGFGAIASSSAGLAWTLGRADYDLTCDTVVNHLVSLCAASSIPVNADFEDGFAREPESMVKNVLRALDAGVAGLSIEDRNRAGFFEPAFATERIKAARVAVDQAAPAAILVARTELLLSDPSAVTPAIDRLVAFAEAGADCLFAPGVRAAADIAAMVRAVAPKPLNVLMSKPGLTFAELEGLGVRRISVGGALARVGWAAVLAAAEGLREGSFDVLAGALPHERMNGLFT
jgi:2-methylisocitrate lyase-like PEP mutase family enzyme